MIVAIHQPNYAPWLGYFAKLARADVFVFLDDAQYSKNSYINRVQIDARGKPRWLTVPVQYQFGNPINRVQAAEADWRQTHLELLRTYYADARAREETSRLLRDVFAHLPISNIADSNQALIEALAGSLGLRQRFVRSSELVSGTERGDDRLIALLRAFGPNVTYLSGKGGANYQNPEKFSAAGIKLIYSDFVHPSYDQGHEFLPGLSIFDALFRLGVERTAALFTPAHAALEK
jgi:hypothetical protein